MLKNNSPEYWSAWRHGTVGGTRVVPVGKPMQAPKIDPEAEALTKALNNICLTCREPVCKGYCRRYNIEKAEILAKFKINKEL